jgi:hypothetical protein
LITWRRREILQEESVVLAAGVAMLVMSFTAPGALPMIQAGISAVRTARFRTAMSSPG